ncbi:hypothetical protein M0R45_009028 [Rubus argutus]|uniref:Uncharacterized protein n=1 Tax=Rubus argutus TaxID=59490 RepID=A0AAW1Y4P4_RUBAR
MVGLWVYDGLGQIGIAGGDEDWCGLVKRRRHLPTPSFLTSRSHHLQTATRAQPSPDLLSQSLRSQWTKPSSVDSLAHLISNQLSPCTGPHHRRHCDLLCAAAPKSPDHGIIKPSTRRRRRLSPCPVHKTTPSLPFHCPDRASSSASTVVQLAGDDPLNPSPAMAASVLSPCRRRIHQAQPPQATPCRCYHHHCDALVQRRR